jgi:hypothetical protein
MKKFIVGLILLFSINSFGQVHVDRHHSIDSLYSSDTITGQCVWEISDSTIIFTQYSEEGEYVSDSKSTGKVFGYRETPITDDYTIKHGGVFFIMSFWKHKELVAYTYADNSFILMYGNIKY